MSNLDQRVTVLEDQVGGIREALAIVQNEQKHSGKTLDRIEAQLIEIAKRNQFDWGTALKNPQTIVLGLILIGGLLGHDTMMLANTAMNPALAGQTLDTVP
jgi:hypothetical protein|tara:strand:+ start:2388 stop:2690 length:303 start_codon:yes stop_codon:yes gene_type:complete